MMLLPFHILAGVLALVFGYAALYAAKGGKLHRKSGMLFVYAMVTMSLTSALMAAIAGSQIRAGGLQGAPRLKRHLWRMCFAMFIASIAFFLGQGRVPEAIRTPALIASGVLLPIAAMSYWLWRLRTRNHVRGMQKVTTYELRNAHSS